MALEAIAGIYEVLRNTGATLKTTFEVDGAPADPDGNAATVTITRADGTQLSTGAATHAGQGVFTVALAPQANLDLLTVVWAGTFAGVHESITEYVELVGDFYVALAELKAMPDLPTGTTDAELVQMRREFEGIAEPYCRNVALVPRFQRDVLPGSGKTRMQLSRLYPTKVLGVSVDGLAVTNLTGYTLYDHGRIENLVAGFPSRTSTVVVMYEHGVPVAPQSLRRHAKLWIRQQLLTDKTGEARDILSQTDGQGYVVRYSTPDWNAGRPTGMFDVDRALNAVRAQLRVV